MKTIFLTLLISFCACDIFAQISNAEEEIISIVLKESKFSKGMKLYEKFVNDDILEFTLDYKDSIGNSLIIPEFFELDEKKSNVKYDQFKCLAKIAASDDQTIPKYESYKYITKRRKYSIKMISTPLVSKNGKHAVIMINSIERSGWFHKDLIWLKLHDGKWVISSSIIYETAPI